MSADPEGDSHMLSSPSDSDPETAATRTPVRRILHNAPGTLSPPDSQPRNTPVPTTATMPTVAPGASGANSNGKRPLQTISNGSDDVEELAAMANVKARQEFPTQVHQPSGYTWNRAELEPGHSWRNKKAVDEAQRAFETLVHRELMVKNRYGDPFEAAENERALAPSLHEQ